MKSFPSAIGCHADLLSKISIVCLCACFGGGAGQALAADKLEARAVLPSSTFAQGPTSGQQLGTAPINGVIVPFLNKQPVQGFSAILDNKDGTFNVMPDNGFGALENSADFHLRVYRIRPDLKTQSGGSGEIEVLSFFELRDPDRKFRLPSPSTSPMSAS